jgi:hypothetical protein
MKQTAFPIAPSHRSSFIVHRLHLLRLICNTNKETMPQFGMARGRTSAAL